MTNFEKWKENMKPGELRLFMFLLSNTIILIAIPLISTFFGVAPEYRLGSAVGSALIFSIFFANVAPKNGGDDIKRYVILIDNSPTTYEYDNIEDARKEVERLNDMELYGDPSIEIYDTKESMTVEFIGQKSKQEAEENEE